MHLRLRFGTTLALSLLSACAEPAPPLSTGPSALDAGFSGLPDAAGDARGDAASSLADAAAVDAGPACENLRCQQRACDGGSTTLSGRVFAPNGTLPLYNVIVYVPNAELEPLTNELTCSQCGVGISGKPVVSALSDATGKFELRDVPVGDNIPLVFQVGKWRRRVVVPRVDACVENRLDDPNLTRLPKTRAEGDMPRIAVTTGDCDPLACLLPKIGIDVSEFGLPGDGRAVSMYNANTPAITGGPGSRWADMPLVQSLWRNAAEMERYDLAMFSCECSEMYAPTLDPEDVYTTKDDQAMKVVTDYLDRGGRIFTTDFQYSWYKYSTNPQMRSAATWPGGANGAPTSTVTLDTSFPKGKALADWLAAIYPSEPRDQLSLNVVFENVGVTEEGRVQTWARSPAQYGGAPSSRFITINTPVGAAPTAQCGKAVHLDAHIVADFVGPDFPASCSPTLSAGEAAFAYFFFDLASCVQQENEPPKPPPTPEPILR